MNSKVFYNSKPIFILLLSVFFVLHSFTENYNLVPIQDALRLISIYVLASLVLVILAWFFFKNSIKASLAVLVLMMIYFFFGSFHDRLKDLFSDSIITRYVFILPVLFLVLAVVLFLLKRSKQINLKFIVYLNFLFAILIFLDLSILTYKIILYEKRNNVKLSGEFIECKECKKPDIYLILTDGYAGNDELLDLFKFDNSSFENELSKRGFRITKNTSGNYNFTPFVMASMLNMDYLDSLEGSNTSQQDMLICYSTIKNNKALQFLNKLGYTFYNYSIFDFERQPALREQTFLPNKKNLITAQTLFSRLYADLGYHLITDLKLEFAIRGFLYSDLYNNNKVYNLTKEVASIKGPKFVYTHLIMPHYPYYFDKNGKLASPEELLTRESWYDKKRYIEYLQYCSQKFLELIDYILSVSEVPPIIILMSDHGFREFKEQPDKKYYFSNLNAVFFPDSNYSEFYDGITNVNQFRVILNSQFKQKLPLLKDSTVFLKY